MLMGIIGKVTAYALAIAVGIILVKGLLIPLLFG
jgi:hypothetical protein